MFVPIHGPNDEFGQGMRIGFDVDMPEVCINRMNGEVQFIGDFLPAFRLGYQADDLYFS
jgi:hypothetical protein